MSNYQESNVTGTKYKRAYQVFVQNGMTDKAITFHEEDVFVGDDGTTTQVKAGSVSETFTDDKAAKAFPIINPIDGSDTGATMTYQEVYVALYSLYLHLAQARDAEAAAEAASGQ